MNTVICVLKSGGFDNGHFKATYTPRHVRWLRDQFEEHTPGLRFVCLTDVNVATVECVPLLHGWKGWWSKIELFREPGRFLYCDLDTVINGDVSDLVNLAQPGEFYALSSLFKKPGVMNSGLMAWDGDFTHLYTEFCRSPEGYMRECTTPALWGDQGYIQRELRLYNREWKAFQSALPHQVISFKADLQKRLPPPRSARIVCFHGVPKPWDAKMRWVPGLGD